MLHGIDIPDSVIQALEKNGILMNVEGKIFFRCHVDLALGILENKVGLLVDRFDVALEVHKELFIDIITAVKHDQLGISELLCDQRTHVGEEHVEGRGIDRCDLLLQTPCFRNLELTEVPHTVPLDQNTLGAVLLFQFHKMGCGKILEVIDDFQYCIGFCQQTFTILLFSFFTDDQKGRTLDLEIWLPDGVPDK